IDVVRRWSRQAQRPGELDEEFGRDLLQFGALDLRREEAGSGCEESRRPCADTTRICVISRAFSAISTSATRSRKAGSS
ncbi:hypothetical protein LNK15_15370, partial [Jeotgalicoccus huakuii]|nr:hypothetical protein [Jeotgalicoccus huakuii]